jgi:hypothetical protein
MTHLNRLRDAMADNAAFNTGLMDLALDRVITTPHIRKIATELIGAAALTDARTRCAMLRRIADHQAQRPRRTRRRAPGQ